MNIKFYMFILMVYDYLIVGAGIAGLNLSLKLSKKFKTSNILVIDSSDSIGGRIQTIYEKDISYESGAGRFNKNHKNLLSYINQYSLNKNIIKIPSSWKYIQVNKKKINSDFEDVNEILNFLIKKFNKPNAQSSKYLRSKNMYEVCADILGQNNAEFLNYSYPYYSEIHILNAYDALNTFRRDLNENLQFYKLGGGLSQITKNIYNDCIENGCDFKLRTKYISSKYLENDKNFEIKCLDKDYQKFTIKSKNLILCVDGKSFQKFNLSNYDKYMKKNMSMKYLQNSISVQPLLRTYAKYKKGKNGVWTQNLSKISTDDKIKYVIPISENVIMISYTDGKYAKYWFNKFQNSTQLEEINKSLEKLFPDNNFSKNPIYLKNYYWEQGAPLWKKNVNSDVLSKIIEKPTKLNLYICGDSFSQRQAWMEGALETSNNIFEKLSNS